MKRRSILLLLLSLIAGCDDSTVNTVSPVLSPKATELLRQELICDTSQWRTIVSQQQSATAVALNSLQVDKLPAMCRLAIDALCVTHTQANICADRPYTGAYGGYYLMRHLMPVVVMTRGRIPGQSHASEITAQSFSTLLNILDLLQPQTNGCMQDNAIRSWCTQSTELPELIPTHQLANAYLVSEILRLALENPSSVSDEQWPSIYRSFDILLWDHVLLYGTAVRNSQTARWSLTPAVTRMRQQLATFETKPNTTTPMQFQVDGWLLAIAANLLAVSHLGEHPLLALGEREKIAIHDLLKTGSTLLEQRLEATQLRDYTGAKANGALFDRLLWDNHEYRRFSAITDPTRPLGVIFDPELNQYKTTFLVGESARYTGTGHDSGHYRRLTWLYYTLSQTGELLDEKWVKRDDTVALANQFAYAVFKHTCQTSNCPEQDTAPPRFANYVSGHDGWYRVTPLEQCEAGVPPSGFSTQMLLSENLWWSDFNSDVNLIWEQLSLAIDDSELKAPSTGVAQPCTDDADSRLWSETYHEKAFRPDASLSYHGLAFFAMRHWAAQPRQ